MSKGENKEIGGDLTSIIYECVAINEKGGDCWKWFFIDLKGIHRVH
jgi:hypothetical protein